MQVHGQRLLLELEHHLRMLALLLATPAWACGGFFCSQQPIDQSTERIFYVVKPGKIDRSPTGTGCSALMAVLRG